MKNPRRQFERFCYTHRSKGIHNLMLYIALGTFLVFMFQRMDPSGKLVNALVFDQSKIAQGQIWRLLTYVFVSPLGASYNLVGGAFNLLVEMFLYYFIGRLLENRWGTLRFNLYYLSGVLFLDLAALIFRVPAIIDSLHLSMILAYATVCPEDRILLGFIIPLKIKYLAWIYVAITAYDVFFLYSFPYSLFPLFTLLNYFLFFGSDIKNLLPQKYFKTVKAKKKNTQQPNNPHAAPNPRWADRYKNANGQKPYRHKCTVCSRTDTEFPDLEFRYCSRCNGYYCYCAEHINNHEHVQ